MLNVDKVFPHAFAMGLVLRVRETTSQALKSKLHAHRRQTSNTTLAYRLHGQ